MSETYEVGDVLYVVFPTRQEIIPVMVVEEAIRNLLNNKTETTYYVITPNSDQRTELSSFEGKVYRDLKQLKADMITNLTKRVHAIVENVALEASRVFNGVGKFHHAVETEKKTDEEGTIIELGDGKKARVRSVKVGETKNA